MNAVKPDNLNLLPLKPGIYLFRDASGVILYVGKASKLRNRVRSYFTPLRQGFGGQGKSNALSPAKQIMVKRLADIQTIITSNETEALILESTLIKKHKPPYNVTLKDDKNFNFIKIDYRMRRPLVTTVRRPEQDAGRSRARYFGPYTYGAGLYENLRLLRRIFPFSKKIGPRTPFERELERKRSLGPIPETDEEYGAMIERFTRVLEGQSDGVLQELRAYMDWLAKEKQYEKAAAVRDQIQGLKQMQSRQKMVSVHGESQDVVSVHREGDSAAVNVFVVRSGKLIDKFNFLLQHTEDKTETEILDAFLSQYYSDATNPPKELILPARTSLTERDFSVIARERTRDRGNPAPQRTDDGIASPLSTRLPPKAGRRNDIIITIPSRGKKRQLIKLGEQNAKEYLAQSPPSLKLRGASREALEELKKTLKLKTIPARIEGFDISNIQGNYSVGSMVVFTDGQPDKNEYRKFKIKSVAGADDFASLAEVLKRRFARTTDKKNTKDTKWPLPDLVLLDGGKGQLSSVLKTLETCNLKLATSQFIALAKREEEVFQGADLKKIDINPASQASRLLQRIRDEAHRFGQAYYHSRHAKANTTSKLNAIAGIGPKTKKLLLQKFGSIAGIRKAEREEIENLIGKAKTKTLLENI